MKTKNLSNKKFLMLGTALVGLHTAGSAVHQEVEAVTAPITAQASIIQAIKLVQSQELNFGRIVAGTAVGKALVNYITGAITFTGGAISGGGGLNTRGKVLMTASGGLGIDLTASVTKNLEHTVTVTKTMVLDAINLDGPNETNTAATGVTNITVTITAGTSTIIGVGGTANVGIAQTQGAYVGSISLVANYQ